MVSSVRGVKRSCGEAGDYVADSMAETAVRMSEEPQPSPGSRERVSGAARTLEVSRAAKARFLTLIADAAEQMPADVVLLASDRSRHPAHRLILGAWSPFFRSMFSTGMREQIQGEVFLQDVSPELLTAVLDWMHCRGINSHLDSHAGVLSLLELAKRWEIEDLCEQLVMQSSLELSDATVNLFWEEADRLSLTSLAQRCCDYVQSRLGGNSSSSNSSSNSSLSDGVAPIPLLRELAPDRFCMMLERDSLPVHTEEAALDLALLYLDQHLLPSSSSQNNKGGASVVVDSAPDGTSHRFIASVPSVGISVSSPQVERILLAVRWRLVPSARITEQAMRHPALLDEAGERLRPGPVASAIADALQFHFLGGKATNVLANARPLPLRASHRIPVPRYEALCKGDPVRVIPSTDTLRELCKRPAPGCNESVGWSPGMEQLAGCLCCVHDLDAETCAAQVEEHEHGYILPFNALLLAN